LERVSAFTRDWDWYAVDEFGVVGHFTTAGFRKLPAVIKGDFEAGEKCIHYFDEAQVRSAYSVSGDLEKEVGAFKGRQGTTTLSSVVRLDGRERTVFI
jgi:hypothetical protein